MGMRPVTTPDLGAAGDGIAPEVFSCQRPALFRTARVRRIEALENLGAPLLFTFAGQGRAGRTGGSAADQVSPARTGARIPA
jgi:hypothetical protein